MSTYGLKNLSAKSTKHQVLSMSVFSRCGQILKKTLDKSEETWVRTRWSRRTFFRDPVRKCIRKIVHDLPNKVPFVCRSKQERTLDGSRDKIRKSNPWLLTERFLDINFLAGDHLERNGSAPDRFKGRQALGQSTKKGRRSRSNAHGRHRRCVSSSVSLRFLHKNRSSLAILSRTETSSLGRTPCVSSASLCGIQVLIDLSSCQWPLELEPRMPIKLFISGHQKSSGSGTETSKLGRRRLRGQFVALCTAIRRGIDPGPKIAFSPVAPRTGTTNANKTLDFRSPKKFRTSKVGRRRLRSQLPPPKQRNGFRSWSIVVWPVAPRTEELMQKNSSSQIPKTIQDLEQDLKGITALSTKSVCKTHRRGINHVASRRWMVSVAAIHIVQWKMEFIQILSNLYSLRVGLLSLYHLLHLHAYF